MRDDAGERLAALGLETLEALFALPATSRPQRGGQVKALAVLDDAEGRLWLKRWDYDRWAVGLRALLRGNFPVFSGRRELENLRALAAAGLRVPRPVLAGEEDRGRRRRACVLLEDLAGAPLDRPPADLAPAARRALARAVGDLARRLHAAGFWHKDLDLGNLRWQPGAPLGFLDCERICWRAGGPRRRWVVKDLAALLGAAGWTTRTDRLRAWRAYLGLEARERPDARARALARDVLRRARRTAARAARLGVALAPSPRDAGARAPAAPDAEPPAPADPSPAGAP